MGKVLNYLVLMIFASTAYGVFAIKDRVSTLNNHINEVVRQIKYERNNIHVLKAEVAYLSSPTVLRELVDSHFELSSIKTTQMVKDPLINAEAPLKVPRDEAIAASSTSKKVNWRYKKNPNKHLKTVSGRR